MAPTALPSTGRQRAPVVARLCAPPHRCAVAVRASGALTPPASSVQRLDGTVKLLCVERDKGVAECQGDALRRGWGSGDTPSSHQQFRLGGQCGGIQIGVG
jgi:hypothetical protein